MNKLMSARDIKTIFVMEIPFDKSVPSMSKGRFIKEDFLRLQGWLEQRKVNTGSYTYIEELFF